MRIRAKNVADAKKLATGLRIPSDIITRKSLTDTEMQELLADYGLSVSTSVIAQWRKEA